MTQEITKILANWQAKKIFQNSEIEYLLTQELSNPQQANVWQPTLDSITKRADLFCRFVDEIILLLKELKFPQPEASLETLWNLWLPLTIKLINARKNQKYPLIQGILGGQGTGKTTLTIIIQLLLKKLGYSSINISIDDIYSTYAERQELLTKDNRLIWRGPPGTHDVKLGIKVLDDLRSYKNEVAIPRFDKSLHNGQGDRISGELVTNVDIILFEGWFVGAIPVGKTAFNNAPNPIITKKDIKFAQDMNENLKEYLPLWERLDALIVLYPINYRWSLEWRKEAEHKMIAAGKTGMNDAQIEQFVNYFWKALHPELFITPLTKNPETDLVIEINQNHSVGNIYSPRGDGAMGRWGDGAMGRWGDGAMG
jgi:D-glycerate 3-kinase